VQTSSGPLTLTLSPTFGGKGYPPAAPKATRVGGKSVPASNLQPKNSCGRRPLGAVRRALREPQGPKQRRRTHGPERGPLGSDIEGLCGEKWGLLYFHMFPGQYMNGKRRDRQIFKNTFIFPNKYTKYLTDFAVWILLILTHLLVCHSLPHPANGRRWSAPVLGRGEG
jgi:hypothetical protein